ncbi:13908_t:CDS:1, partial [Racocetra fulgida]
EEEYEDKELIPYEAYNLKAEPVNAKDLGWTVYQRKTRPSRKKKQG